MRRLAILAIALLALAALFASAARAEFGLRSFDVQMAADPPADLTNSTTYPDDPYTQAGGHPYAIVTHLEWNGHPDPKSDPPNQLTPDGDLKSTEATLPPGLVGNPVEIPQCSAAQLAGAGPNPSADPPLCPTDSQVGIIHLYLNTSKKYEASGGSTSFPIFNMAPPAGTPARFAFDVGKVLVYFDAGLVQDGSYRLSLSTRNAPQALRIVGADVTFWGVPADEAHFPQRCTTIFPGLPGDRTHAECHEGDFGGSSFEPIDLGPQHAGTTRVGFLRMPTSCTAEGVGQGWNLRTSSWEDPDTYSTASLRTHRPPYAPSGSPGPEEGTDGCERVPFSPKFTAQPTQQEGASSSGLEVGLEIPNDGLLNPDGIGQSDLKKAVVTLPEGMTVNPSQAEGLEVCKPAQYDQASLTSYGCPATSKIGNVVVHTPLLEEAIEGNVYMAQPNDPYTATRGAENPFDSLLALYIILRNPERGIAIKLPGIVEPDPRTGQITATFDDLPQLPFESFAFKFREGPRAPLITPRTCGTYATEADFYPWARPNQPIHTTSSFQIKSGPGGEPCPRAGVPPFRPGFSAGTQNNAGGSYSPFLMRLTRADGEQDLTKFSALLPPGVAAKIAGVTKCPDSWLALASQKTGIEERESPSCPANSEIGNILAGAGVGSTLVYVPGKLYLSGPYNGAPLSAVAIVPAVAGPFDVGTVITRVALSLDPKTAEVRVDGDRSDPIPHILAGIPLSVREIRVDVDRPSFTINPTSCDPFEVGATLFGSNQDLFSSADDLPVSLASRFQAASCASLGFRPKLSIRLTGGTERGDFPGLKAELRPRAGDANSKKAVVTLPRSAFLEQSHIRTICTRVQYAAKACPQGSIYGQVKAWTPLLDEPLSGPVYLRSSNHKLPDMVLALSGIVDIEAVGRIDSKNGGIRASFEGIPDAPISKVLLRMQGQKKGLIVNSLDLCEAKPQRAKALFDAQNGKAHDFKPAIKSSCAQASAKRRDRK